MDPFFKYFTEQWQLRQLYNELNLYFSQLIKGDIYSGIYIIVLSN